MALDGGAGTVTTGFSTTAARLPASLTGKPHSPLPGAPPPSASTPPTPPPDTQPQAAVSSPHGTTAMVTPAVVPTKVAPPAAEMAPPATLQAVPAAPRDATPLPPPSTRPVVVTAPAPIQRSVEDAPIPAGSAATAPGAEQARRTRGFFHRLPEPDEAAKSSPFAHRPGEKAVHFHAGASAAGVPTLEDADALRAPRQGAPEAGPIQTPAPATPTSGRLWTWIRLGVRYAAIAVAVWFATTVAAIVLFRFVDPPGSMLMLFQRVGGTPITQRWTPIERISPNLVRAVVVSEDGRFCSHWGIDPEEILAAIQRARDGVPRGASTITMQVAKNMFLWPSKSYVRKALEVPATLALEVFWPKRRILEVYLNIAEWGPGVFGAEAASQHHFRKSADKLSRREAALLAVSLPAPLQRVAGRPGALTARLGRLIESRMSNSPSAGSCALR
ncbi:MAG: monofunctional biosynthetic peptidoglycan transglycosylase [Hyphomicrobiaceae bacterium]|nr:monofunctional biosynthetic peptidoglycan transglycosylase [Hyphomicrobiaceae bacterium]